MITPHMSQDLVYYLAFLAGQLLFVLKRSASAIRSKLNPIATRRAFFVANWDLLLIRCALEAPIFYVYRHYDVNSVLSLFTTWQVPFHIPQSAMTAFLFGYLADSLLDWFGASAKAPEWLKETIPGIQVFAQHTVGQGTDATGAPVTIEKTVTVTGPSVEVKP